MEASELTKERRNCPKITSWKRPFLEIIENKFQKARYTNHMEIFDYLESEDKKENKGKLKYLALKYVESELYF